MPSAFLPAEELAEIANVIAVSEDSSKRLVAIEKLGEMFPAALASEKRDWRFIEVLLPAMARIVEGLAVSSEPRTELVAHHVALQALYSKACRIPDGNQVAFEQLSLLIQVRYACDGIAAIAAESAVGLDAIRFARDESAFYTMVARYSSDLVELSLPVSELHSMVLQRLMVEQGKIGPQTIMPETFCEDIFAGILKDPSRSIQSLPKALAKKDALSLLWDVHLCIKTRLSLLCAQSRESTFYAALKGVADQTELSFLMKSGSKHESYNLTGLALVGEQQKLLRLKNGRPLLAIILARMR